MRTLEDVIDALRNLARISGDEKEAVDVERDEALQERDDNAVSRDLAKGELTKSQERVKELEAEVENARNELREADKHVAEQNERISELDGTTM